MDLDGRLLRKLARAMDLNGRLLRKLARAMDLNGRLLRKLASAVDLDGRPLRKLASAVDLDERPLQKLAGAVDLDGRSFRKLGDAGKGSAPCLGKQEADKYSKEHVATSCEMNLYRLAPKRRMKTDETSFADSLFILADSLQSKTSPFG